MELLLLIALLLSIMSRLASAILSERISYSFAGSNNYYLHALLPAEQVAYIGALQADGAKVVRLWGMSLLLTHFHCLKVQIVFT
jgi:mannan endo-1,4-beta-mannosidase